MLIEVRPREADDGAARSQAWHQAIAARARAALTDELRTWPKPGLVSHVDRGSHDDMNARSFERSIEAIAPFFARLAAEAADGVDLSRLRRTGIEAEAAMLAATGGVNTHRGAIFALGLLAAAAGLLSETATPQTLCVLVEDRWGPALLASPREAASQGLGAMRRFGVGGARGEAASGFATARNIGLPAVRQGGVLRPGDPEAARVHCFFALLAAVDDTNLLHRGGAEGLAFVRREAAAFHAAGGIAHPDWRRRAEAVHRACVARWLSPGGSADLLAMTLFLDSFGA